MATTMMDRLEAWAVSRRMRACGDETGGSLRWMDDAGQVRDLGTYTKAELEGLAWAVSFAYRAGRMGSTSDRVRLAGIREVARRILVGLRGVH